MVNDRRKFSEIVWKEYWSARTETKNYDLSIEQWFHTVTGYHIFDMMITMDYGLTCNTTAPDDYIIQTILSERLV